MSLQLPALNSFTVVLIGGTATLIDGGEIDTRSAHEDDPLSSVAHAVAANSTDWWETATSLVGPMVDATDHLKQASVFGKRTVARVEATGETKRQRLSTFLEGGVAAVKDETVTKRFDDADWLLNSYELHAKRQLNEDLRCNLFVSTDEEMFTVRYEKQPLFERFETFVDPGSVLIVPHTRLVERFLQAYSEHVNLSRAPAMGHFLEPENERSLAEHHPPIATNATFQVTGLFAANNWQSPTALEAARRLMQTRFDLQLGLWDVVNDEPLREALLDEKPLAAVGQETVPLPGSYLSYAKSKIAEREQHERDAEEEQNALLEQASTMLSAKGWRLKEERDNHFVYVLAGSENERNALLRFDLYINKTSSSVYVASGHGELTRQLTHDVTSLTPRLESRYEVSEYKESVSGNSIWKIQGVDPVSVAERVLSLQPMWETTFESVIASADSIMQTRARHGAAMAERAEGYRESINRAFTNDPQMAVVAVNGLADPSGSVRRETIELLANRNADVVSVFQDVALTDPDENVRLAATNQLTSNPQYLKSSADCLLQIVTNDQNPRVRRAAVTYYMGDTDGVLPVLSCALDDEDTSVVEGALSTIQWRRSPLPTSIVPKVHVHAKSDSERVRKVAAEALEYSEDSSSKDVLMSMSKDENVDVRAAAIGALAGERRSTNKFVYRISAEPAPEASTQSQKSSSATPERGAVANQRSTRPPSKKMSPIPRKLTNVLNDYLSTTKEVRESLDRLGVIRSRSAADKAKSVLDSTTAALLEQQEELQQIATMATYSRDHGLSARAISSLTDHQERIARLLVNLEEQREKLAVFDEVAHGSADPAQAPMPPQRPKREAPLPPPPPPPAGRSVQRRNRWRKS